MKNCFCTLFDHRYLDRGVALYESIYRYCGSFQLWVLCMDGTSFDVLDGMNLKNMHLVQLGQLEEEDLALNDVKKQRTQVEYYFTCKPSLALYVLKQCESATQVIYMDADIYFFASPEVLYDELENHSVAITPHRFSVGMEHLEKYGKYNAGWLLFKRDENGLTCLQWWRERCIEWCRDFVEPDRYADQKYIDQFPLLFKGVLSVENVGVNLGPWNINAKDLMYQNNELYVDGDRLIFFHFHNLRSVTPRIFDLGFAKYAPILNNVARKYIYKPYLAVLLREREGLSFTKETLQRGKQKISCDDKGQSKNLLQRCAKKIDFAISVGKGLREGRYMIGIKARS